MQIFIHHVLIFILVSSYALQIDAVTVNPLAPMCPTNKVAPRRKRYDKVHPRTFGQFYNLLRPDVPSSLQEKPQEDAPDDCGEIEDYDENDISSVTPQAIRRQGQKHYYGGTNNLLNHHHYHGIRPPTPNNKPTRPPPAGYFGNNNYSPPRPLKPTDYLKPVHEPGHELPVTYRPIVVAAPSGHLIGLPQKQGSIPPSDTVASNKKSKYANRAHAHAPASSNVNKHHRQRKFSGDSGIIGSFVDLFF